MNLIQSGLDLINKGGWVMVPLVFLSIISLTVMLERGLSIREAALDAEKLFADLEPLLQERRFSQAVERCRQDSGPVAAILATGISNRHLDFPDIERAMEELALRETPLLQQRLSVLDTIITMAPLMGLLGTITGMIRSFKLFGSQGLVDPAGVTGGVAEALIATALGLFVALIALFAFNYFSDRQARVMDEMERLGTRLVDHLRLDAQGETA